MAQVKLSFHDSLQLPASARGLSGTALPLEPGLTVRELAAAIERRCAAAGAGVRVGFLINPLRGRACPPHEEAVAHFQDGDCAVVVGDLQATPWLEAPAVKTRVVGEPIPITIFTGFLGAGKTTVLNHLLQKQRDKKFAVIENEFGEVPIDNELLQNSAMDLAEQVVVMENGCMCCTVRGDLLGAFDSIRRQMEEKGSHLDAVLVETTGLADPVPIVRTLRQTPDIARHFRLDGTIALVDAKTILERLAECAEADQQDMERHRQIAFADRILLNKVDLVTDEEAVEVWHRIRSYNDSAKIVASVKGVVPASDLTGLSAFDPDSIAFEQEERGGHESGHGGGHSHGGHEDCYEDHGQGGHEGHGGGHGDGHGAGHITGHGHGLSDKHDNEIGSFSIVRKGVEVEPLAFARWVRVLATLPEDQGRVYRSKGVLAAVGKQAKLVFHAVADVTETSDGPCWREDETRICKIVFIGKKLARKEIEERFLQLLQPVGKRLRPALAAPVMSERKTLVALTQGGMVHHALLGCWLKDVIRVSQTCACLRDALLSPSGHAFFQAAASTLPDGSPRGLQTVEGALWLHGLLPLTSIKAYAQSWRGARIKLNTACSGEYMWGEPLRFDDVADAEAAGVMWQEVCELTKGSDESTSNFLIEFRWRPETMKSFFDVAGSGTNSTLVKITVQDPSDSDLDDDLRFRVNLNPEQSEDAAAMSLHRLSLQLVGGKTSNHVYQIFFHTVDPAYQVHINVPDHRTPIFPTKEVFHQWHPLMAGLRRRPRLRFLLRLKSMESGPLDAMCGCCG